MREGCNGVGGNKGFWITEFTYLIMTFLSYVISG